MSGLKTGMCDIAKIYFVTAEFWMDLAAVIPLELLCFVDETSTAEERWRLTGYLKLNRIIKLSTVRPGLT